MGAVDLDDAQNEKYHEPNSLPTRINENENKDVHEAEEGWALPLPKRIFRMQLVNKRSVQCNCCPNSTNTTPSQIPVNDAADDNHDGGCRHAGPSQTGCRQRA